MWLESVWALASIALFLVCSIVCGCYFYRRRHKNASREDIPLSQFTGVDSEVR